MKSPSSPGGSAPTPAPKLLRLAHCFVRRSLSKWVKARLSQSLFTSGSQEFRKSNPASPVLLISGASEIVTIYPFRIRACCRDRSHQSARVVSPRLSCPAIVRPSVRRKANVDVIKGWIRIYASFLPSGSSCVRELISPLRLSQVYYEERARGRVLFRP